MTVRPSRPAAAVPAAPSPLLSALASLSETDRLDRKLLIGPDINWGRELLTTLARRTGGWIGWEPTTLAAIARELAFVDLGNAGRRAGGDVEIAVLVDRALDQAIGAREVSPAFADLAGGLGFRRAVRDALLQVRTAGLTPDALRRAAPPATPAHDLAAVLGRYIGLLASGALVDPAGIFELALEAFDRESPYVLADRMVLAPGLRAAGLPGRLLDRLIASGARPLPSDRVIGAVPPSGLAPSAEERGIEPWPAGEAPRVLSPLSFVAEPAALLPAEADGSVAGDAVTLTLFHAATPADEIREALRRVLAEGLRWDEVELVTTDRDSYGIALDAVCGRLGIPHSSLHGVPFARTRLGRALDRWLAWIGDGLPADTLREALEAGDLASPEEGSAPTALARLFRQLQIGWGRGRYHAALDRLGDPQFVKRVYRREDETDEEYAGRVQARGAATRALSALIERLLVITPEVPERGAVHPVVLSATALAEATLNYLALVPTHGPAEEHAKARLESRLDELRCTEQPAVGFATALAQLRDALSDLRAWTTMGDGGQPWRSAGGMLYLTDLAHAGTTGRPRVFVLGLDADRAGGARAQDPILNDAARLALASPALATSAQRREQKSWDVAASLARLRGTVTLSCAAASDSADRPVGPSHLLLQALRLIERNPALGYDELRTHLGTPACGVPVAPGDALDVRESWLAALTDGPLLLDGQLPVRAAHPLLDAGLRAQELSRGAALTAYHGLVPAAAGAYDPRRGKPISSSSLEMLGRCPLAWFYQYGLRISPPSDPVYDAEHWLDAMQRGSLLHALFERFGREYQGRQVALVTEAARERMLALAEEVVGEWRDEVPPPSEAVFQSEAAELRQSALAFLQGERDRLPAGTAGEWLAFEEKFDPEHPAVMTLSHGAALRLTGIIDRVDRLADDSLRVVDYKTGSPGSYRQSEGEGPFKGGRRLQAAVYASAAGVMFAGEVSRFEYRFPTVRGQNVEVPYGRADFGEAVGIIEGLLQHPAGGEFIPTNDANDCRYCDHRAICRVTDGGWKGPDSPRAAWADEHAAALPAYAAMLRRRAPADPQ